MESSLSDSRKLRLAWLHGEFAICRLDSDAPAPNWANSPGRFASVTRTDTELSVICGADLVPTGVKCTRGWRLGRLEGTFPHDCAGVLASVVSPIAAAGISVFVCATFDTDYLLVAEAQVGRANRALVDAGHSVRGA